MDRPDPRNPRHRKAIGAALGLGAALVLPCALLFPVVGLGALTGRLGAECQGTVGAFVVGIVALEVGLVLSTMRALRPRHLSPSVTGSTIPRALVGIGLLIAALTADAALDCLAYR